MTSFQADIKRKQPILSLLILIIYRFGNYVFYKIKIPLIRQLLWIIYRVMDITIVRALMGCEIPAQCKIGAGLSLRHPNGIIIHQSAIIGANVTLYQQVTIGIKNSDNDITNKAANLGDNVLVSAGAKLIGHISVQNHAVIGANAVVLKDVPEHAVAVGVPAKIK